MFTTRFFEGQKANNNNVSEHDLEHGYAMLLKPLVAGMSTAAADENSINSSDPSSSALSYPSLALVSTTQLTWANPETHAAIDADLKVQVDAFVLTLFTQLKEDEQLFCRRLIQNNFFTRQELTDRIMLPLNRTEDIANSKQHKFEELKTRALTWATQVSLPTLIITLVNLANAQIKDDFFASSLYLKYLFFVISHISNLHHCINALNLQNRIKAYCSNPAIALNPFKEKLKIIRNTYRDETELELFQKYLVTTRIFDDQPFDAALDTHKKNFENCNDDLHEYKALWNPYRVRTSTHGFFQACFWISLVMLVLRNIDTMKKQPKTVREGLTACPSDTWFYVALMCISTLILCQKRIYINRETYFFPSHIKKRTPNITTDENILKVTPPI